MLWQECRDLVGVVTLGSCSKALTPRAMRYLLPVPRLLVAFDADKPGEEGAARLLELSARMTRITVPAGSDITDFYLAGGRLRDWITFYMAQEGLKGA